MKKIFILTLLNFSIFSFAQSPLEKGEIQLNGGFESSNWATPIYLGADYGITKPITVGLEASYQTYNTYGIKVNILGLQANGNYHFNELLSIPSNWDVYSGLNLNYYSYSIKDSSSSITFNDDKPIGLGLQIGGRYFINEKFGFNLEFRAGNVSSMSLS